MLIVFGSQSFIPGTNIPLSPRCARIDPWGLILLFLGGKEYPLLDKINGDLPIGLR